jgi:hypothetical protein
LTQKMPLAIADMALDLGEVIEKLRLLHAAWYPFDHGGGKQRAISCWYRRFGFPHA